MDTPGWDCIATMILPPPSEKGAGISRKLRVKVKSLQMKISKLALALLPVCFAASTAYAQLGVYGTVSVRRMTDIPYTQGNTSYTNGTVNPIGGTGGIFYDFKTFGIVRLGVEGRGVIANSTQSAYPGYNAGGTHLSSGLGGVHLQFHTPFIPVKPYVSGMAGVARTNFGTNYNTSLATGPISGATSIPITTHPEWDIFAGVDYTILPVLDFRVVELGYGSTFGNSHTYPIESISTGIVFHLPLGLGK